MTNKHCRRKLTLVFPLALIHGGPMDRIRIRSMYQCLKRDLICLALFCQSLILVTYNDMYLKIIKSAGIWTWKIERFSLFSFELIHFNLRCSNYSIPNFQIHVPRQANDVASVSSWVPEDRPGMYQCRSLHTHLPSEGFIFFCFYEPSRFGVNFESLSGGTRTLTHYSYRDSV